MKIFTWVREKFSFWKENTVIFPVILLALYLGLHSFFWTTQRASDDDVGSIVGWLINMVGGAFIVSATGGTQLALYGYRAKERGSLVDDVHDSCVTSFLLVFWYLVVFGLPH